MTFYTSYYGDQRYALGFERLASVGTGIEVVSSEKPGMLTFNNKNQLVSARFIKFS